MQILHVLDHSIPLQSSYAFRTLSILTQQRARMPVLNALPTLCGSGLRYCMNRILETIALSGARMP